MSQYTDPRAEQAYQPLVGEQQQQQLANAYAAPDAYTSHEYQGAQGLGVDAQAAASPWTQYADEQGNPYW